MKKFLVSNKVRHGEYLNVGIAPGKFDTKQLILSALVVLERSTENEFVQFVRTINRNELSKCRLFINDDFTSEFPQIPSYHDIDKTWHRTCKKILSKYGNYEDENFKVIVESVKEKICDLEAIDCIMELYEVANSYSDSFEDALNLTLKLIEKFISDSLSEIMFFPTVKSYVEKATTNYVYLPLYVQGWRSIIKNVNCSNNINYAIFPEDTDNSKNYIIESFNKDIIMKKYVKGQADVCYSGRYFIKVTNIDAALKVIDRLPILNINSHEHLA